MQCINIQIRCTNTHVCKNTQIRSNMHKYKQSQNTDSELLEYEQTPKAVQVHATHEYIHLPVLALI